MRAVPCVLQDDRVRYTASLFTYSLEGQQHCPLIAAAVAAAVPTARKLRHQLNIDYLSVVQYGSSCNARSDTSMLEDDASLLWPQSQLEVDVTMHNAY
jgi:hypothetical protein